MPTTIVLANYNDKLANELTARGFRVVAGTCPGRRPEQTATAYLYTSYRPDTDCLLTAQTEPGDISIGNYHYTTTEHPATIPLNITGLTAEQIVDKLHHQLARRCQL